MDLEKLATSTITLSISATEFLSSSINEGDRDPSWDGYIYIFGDKSKKKSTMIGRVPVQVKGQANNDLSKKQINYSVDTADLQNFLNDGGAIYFVVYIPHNSHMPKIYYTILLPVKLRIIMAQCKAQKTKTIELQEFPSDNTQKISVFSSFIENRKKQASFADAKLLSLEDYEEKGVLESITMAVTGHDLDKNDPQKALFENEVYMYANIIGSSIPQPLEIMPMGLHISEQVASMITANTRLFYTEHIRVRSKEKTVIKIGQSTQIIMSSNQNGPFKIIYKTAPKLCDIAKDLDFLFAALDAKQFEINGVRYPLSPSKEELAGFDIEEQRNVLATTLNVMAVFEMLGLDTSMEISSLSSEDRLNIGRLIKAFIAREPVGGLKDDIPFVARLEIAGRKIALAFQHCEAANTYTISDYFKTRLATCCEIDGERFPVSQYAILGKNDYLELANLDLSVLLPSYQEIAGNPQIYERANTTLLSLLSAYDESGDNRQELLSTAKAFAEWLCGIEIDDTNLDGCVRELNRLQAIKRERALNRDEIKYLCSIAEDTGQREDVKVGAYLLLDNQVAAEMHFDRINTEYQDEFKQYPIFRFWTKTEEDKHNG